ncbi:MAG TPA: TIM barrel protein [Methylomirabilota bacterium]|nr:TIM barrel protein [Methylomirabilota bacterium]
MKLGLSSYTYGWAVGVKGHLPAQPLDEQGLLRKTREHGLSLLQIGDNLPLHTFTPERLAAFGAAAHESGVQIEVGTRGLTVERVEQCASIARQLEAKLIRIVIDDNDYHPPLPEIVSLLKDCVPLLDSLTLGVENHDRFKSAELRKIIDEVGSDRLGICLDTANSLGAGEGLDTVLQWLAEVTVNLHIKDVQIRRVPHMQGFTVEGCAAGEGVVDIPALLAKLSTNPHCRTAILELWTTPELTLEATLQTEDATATRSIQYLRRFVVGQLAEG